jgi:hypothetical protein
MLVAGGSSVMFLLGFRHCDVVLLIIFNSTIITLFILFILANFVISLFFISSFSCFLPSRSIFFCLTHRFDNSRENFLYTLFQFRFAVTNIANYTRLTRLNVQHTSY